MLYVCQHLFRTEAWNAKLVYTVFWSLQIGLALMMFLDLFPIGIYQTILVMTDGLWYARSAEVVLGPVWETFTALRGIGGAVFAFGGVAPLIWFVLSRAGQLQREVEVEEGEWSAGSHLWVDAGDEGLPSPDSSPAE